MRPLILILLTVLALSGCANMTPQEKKTMTVLTVIVIGGSLYAYKDGDSECVDRDPLYPRCD